MSKKILFLFVFSVASIFIVKHVLVVDDNQSKLDEIKTSRVDSVNVEGYGTSKWGMSISELNEIEKGSLVIISESDPSLKFAKFTKVEKEVIGIYSLNVVYNFDLERNKLIQIYFPAEGVGSKLNLYEYIKGRLTLQYGEPDTDKPLNRSEFADGWWGMASSAWRLGNTVIKMDYLHVSDGKVTDGKFILMYLDSSYYFDN
ncbi:MAG: hypothetical protein E6Q75_16850 [Rheinheimera sp.]|nr:MAG: hypothetical protein E6Q75_16850 [Rheinheimera sp.]